MTTTLSPEEFLQLAGIENEKLLCSLYLPLEAPQSNDLRNRQLQLKNAVGKVRTALSAKSWQNQNAQGLLSFLEGLSSHPHFVDPSTAGLAILASAQSPEQAKVLALNFQPEESVTLGERYMLTPLLKVFGSPRPRTVLALAEGGLRMLRGTAQHLETTPLPATFPKDRDEVTKFEEASGLDPRHSTQHRAGPGRSSHGEGPKESVELEFSKRFYRAVGAALGEILEAQETVLLAGVHEQLSLFRKMNPELPLLHPELNGNFETLAEESLREKATAVLAEVERDEDRAAVKETQELSCDWWTSDLEQALAAARQGRVHQLFLNPTSQDDILVEELTLEVLKHKGSVRTSGYLGQAEGVCLAHYRWSESPQTTKTGART